MCANFGIRLIYDKQYGAWSKGKIDRLLLAVRGGFEQRLVFGPIKALVNLLLRNTCRTMILPLASLTSAGATCHMCHTRVSGFAQRRSGNIMLLRKLRADRDGLWQVPAFEEAQNLSAMELEAMRLMYGFDTQPHVSLLLAGDWERFPRLNTGGGAALAHGHLPAVAVMVTVAMR